VLVTRTVRQSISPHLSAAPLAHVLRKRQRCSRDQSTSPRTGYVTRPIRRNVPVCSGGIAVQCPPPPSSQRAIAAMISVLPCLRTPESRFVRLAALTHDGGMASRTTVACIYHPKSQSACPRCRTSRRWRAKKEKKKKQEAKSEKTHETQVRGDGGHTGGIGTTTSPAAAIALLSSPAPSGWSVAAPLSVPCRCM
jgi:hypothetical protein